MPSVALGPRVQIGWQWSTNQPGSEPHPMQGLYVIQMLVRRAESMVGMCENDIMSAESHFLVFIIG